MKNTNLTVLVCGHDLKFLTPFVERLENSKGITTRTLMHKGHHMDDERAAEEALAWADVVFCEWALGNAAWFSRRKRDDQVLIVRLHMQEVRARDRLDFIWTTDWERVDRLILITNHVYDWMRQEFAVLASRSALVYNPIPAKGALNLPKNSNVRFVLGFVGIVPALKRLDLAVDVLKCLRAKDKRYTLRVKGSLPTDYPWMAQRTAEMSWYTQVFEDLRELREAGVVVFDPHGPNMAEWYQGIGHILSVSDIEGSHQAVAEGMATGCVPAIRDWEGAGRIYPAKYVASTVEALATIILQNSNVDVFGHESEYCRAFAQERFDQESVCDVLEACLLQEARRNTHLQLRAPRRRAVLFAAPTILILAYIPIGSRSGYRIRVEQEIKTLIQQGCIVHLSCLVPAGGGSNIGNSDLKTRKIEEDAHIQEFLELGCAVHLIEIEDFFRKHADATSFPAVTALLSDLIKKHHIDVIHAEALYCARLAAMVKEAMPNIAFSIDWHGVAPEEARMGGSHESRVKAMEDAERLLLHACDLNVFVSKVMETHYCKKYDFKTLRHVTVPCCVSDERFPVLHVEDATKMPADGALIFAYAGTMVDWQCGPEMIELFSALHRHDARCRFMLLVPKSDQPKVHEYAERSGLPQEAYNMTEVAHHEVPGRLRQSHVGVLIRKNDPVNVVSSPTKFGEYLAAGLPVLMTDCIGDFSQLVADQSVGFVIPSECLNKQGMLLDQKMLEGLIIFVEQARRERLPIGRKCQMLAKHLLLWENASRNWLDAYKGLGNEP